MLSGMTANLTEQRPYDPERFRRLALYIASRSVNDPKFGKTKLAKIMFYSDFIAFTELGDSITGAMYVRAPQGPYPRGAMEPALWTARRCGEGVIVNSNYMGRSQQRLVATEDVDASIFSGPEISLVEQVIEALRDMDASDVSALSHLAPGWKYADEWANIPYSMAFVSDDPLDEDAIEIGQQVAKELGLLVNA